MNPFSVKNLKVTTALSAGIMKLTPQNCRGERGEVQDRGTNAVVSG